MCVKTDKQSYVQFFISKKDRMILAVRLSDHINRATEIGKQRILDIRRSGTTY